MPDDVKPPPGLSLNSGSEMAVRPTVRDPADIAMSSFVSLPRFNGDGSLRRYLEDYDRYARIQGWDERRKLDVLPLTLTGIARDAYDGLPASQLGSFSGVVEGLQSAFTKASVTDHHLALRNLRYSAEEPLDAFVIRFKKLMKLAFPTVDDLTPLLFSHFLATLPQEYYTAVIADGISSFDSAVTKVRNIQCSRVTIGAAASPLASAVSPDQRAPGSQSSVKPVRVLESEQSVVDALNKRVSELEARLAAVTHQAQMNPNVSNRPSRVQRLRGDAAASVTCHCCGRAGHVRNRCRVNRCRCFVCGGEGHIAKVCPERQQGNEQGSGRSHGGAGRTQ